MIHSNRKNTWIFGWNPPWHRKDSDTNQLSSVGEQHRRPAATSHSQHQPKKSVMEGESIYYNGNGSYNDNDSIVLSQLDQNIDTGYSSPLSSSSSSFTSSFKRNTKASVLDFFHRRKSSTPSIMSSQQSSQQSFPSGPLSSVPAGRKSTMPTITQSSAPHISAASTAGSTQIQSANNNAIHASSLSSTSPPCSGISLHQTIANTNTGTTTSSSTNQHHRFPFIHHHQHHHQQTENINTSNAIPEEQHPPLYQHRQSSLSPHNALAPHSSSNSTPRSSSISASVRPYDSLIKNSDSFSEHTMDMGNNAPPTIDDTKRITLRHDLIKLALDGLFKSPLDPQQESERQVLQIGCGNGSWCVDCAKEFPHWFILGLDDRNGGPLISAASGKKILLSGTSFSSSSSSVSPLLPLNNPTLGSSSASSSTTAPPAPSSSISSSTIPGGGHGNNFRFIRSATSLVESLKMIPDGQFDLVYGRFLALSLPPSEYEDLVSECWRVCKSGGFVEFTELDMRIYGSSGSGILVKRLNQQVVSAMKKRKLDPRLPRHLQDLFFKLLVEDQPASSRRRQTSYQVKYNSLPLGVWGGRIGVMFRDDIHDVLDALDVATCPIEDEDDDDDGGGKDGEQRLPEDDWKATTDILDDELDSHMAFMNLYQIFAQKHKV